MSGGDFVGVFLRSSCEFRNINEIRRCDCLFLVITGAFAYIEMIGFHKFVGAVAAEDRWLKYHVDVDWDRMHNAGLR
jgi:hypothetical protein